MSGRQGRDGWAELENALKMIEARLDFLRFSWVSVDSLGFWANKEDCLGKLMDWSTKTTLLIATCLLQTHPVAKTGGSSCSLKNLYLKWCPAAEGHHPPKWFEITPASDPKQFGGSQVNAPDTSDSTYGTVRDEVGHDRKCSSRTCYIDLYRGAHKTFIQELPMSIPEELSDKHQRRGSSRP